MSNILSEKTYKIIININLNKRFIIEKYSKMNRKPDYIRKKVRDISEDKTNWFTTVINRIRELIAKNDYRLNPEMFAPAFLLTNEVTDIDKKTFDGMANQERNSAVKQMLDDNTDNQVRDVYIAVIDRYTTVNDEQLGFIVLLLSDLAKEADTLWTMPILMIKQIGGAIFYFTTPNGKVVLSKRSFSNINVTPEINTIANNYIDGMNNLIDGKTSIPYYQKPRAI